MKAIVFIFAVLFSFNAHAFCGTSFEITGDRENGVSTRGESSRDNTIGFKIKIPFFDNSCEKDEAAAAKARAETRDKEADAMDQKIRNLNRIIDICKKQDIPSLCSRIPEMAAEINLD